MAGYPMPLPGPYSTPNRHYHPHHIPSWRPPVYVQPLPLSLVMPPPHQRYLAPPASVKRAVSPSVSNISNASSRKPARNYVVKLPKESSSDSSDQPPSLWCRVPLDALPEQTVAPLQPRSREMHFEEDKGLDMPSSIDIYLPGQMAWLDVISGLDGDDPDEIIQNTSVISPFDLTASWAGRPLPGAYPFPSQHSRQFSIPQFQPSPLTRRQMSIHAPSFVPTHSYNPSNPHPALYIPPKALGITLRDPKTLPKAEKKKLGLSVSSDSQPSLSGSENGSVSGEDEQATSADGRRFSIMTQAMGSARLATHHPDASLSPIRSPSAVSEELWSNPSEEERAVVRNERHRQANLSLESEPLRKDSLGPVNIGLGYPQPPQSEHSLREDFIFPAPPLNRSASGRPLPNPPRQTSISLNPKAPEFVVRKPSRQLPKIPIAEPQFSFTVPNAPTLNLPPTIERKPSPYPISSPDQSVKRRKLSLEPDADDSGLALNSPYTQPGKDNMLSFRFPSSLAPTSAAMIRSISSPYPPALERRQSVYASDDEIASGRTSRVSQVIRRPSFNGTRVNVGSSTFEVLHPRTASLPPFDLADLASPPIELKTQVTRLRDRRNTVGKGSDDINIPTSERAMSKATVLRDATSKASDADSEGEEMDESDGGPVHLPSFFGRSRNSSLSYRANGIRSPSQQSFRRSKNPSMDSKVDLVQLSQLLDAKFEHLKGLSNLPTPPTIALMQNGKVEELLANIKSEVVRELKESQIGLLDALKTRPSQDPAFDIRQSIESLSSELHAKTAATQDILSALPGTLADVLAKELAMKIPGSLEKQIEDLRSLIVGRDEVNANSKELADLRTQVSLLNTNLAAEQIVKSDLMEKTASQNSELLEHCQRLSAADARNELLNSTIAEARMSQDAATAREMEHLKQLTELRAKIGWLEEELHEAKTAVPTAEFHQDFVKGLVEGKKEEMEELREEKATLEGQVMCLRERIAEQDQQLGEATTAAVDAATAKFRFENQISQLEEAGRQRDRVNASLQEHVQALQSQIANLHVSTQQSAKLQESIVAENILLRTIILPEPAPYDKCQSRKRSDSLGSFYEEESVWQPANKHALAIDAEGWWCTK